MGTHFDISHSHATPTRLPAQARQNTRVLGISLGTDQAQGCALGSRRCRRDAQAGRGAGCCGRGCKTPAARRERQEGPAGGQEQQRGLWPLRAPGSALCLQQPRLESESQRRFRRSRVTAGGRRLRGVGLHRPSLGGHLQVPPPVFSCPSSPFFRKGPFCPIGNPPCQYILAKLGRGGTRLKATPIADGVGEPQGQPAESPVGPLQTPRAH